MTGFGRYELDNAERKLTVEIKSVNHRYLEMTVKSPKKLSFFESGIRSLLKQYINRGKVDVFITYEDYTEGKACVKYNEEIAKEYYNGLVKMSGDFNIPNDVSVSVLSKFPDVFTLDEQTIDEDKLWDIIKTGIECAAEKFVAARISEGEHLKQDILAKLEGMLEVVSFIQVREPEIVNEYRNRIRDKVSELLGDTKIDESILATEITVFADKICVDEETVRLKAHISSMIQTITDGVNVGRKLDFIAQEMNREANTILSKASDLEVTNQAINLKTEIEKIREQIQNIE